MTSTTQTKQDHAGVAGGERTLRSGNGKWVLIATIFASSMAFIDGTAVTVALPAIQNQLHATGTQIQWIIEAYALFLASLLLVGGSLGDVYGRRRIFVIGVVLFAFGSASCGLSPTILWLMISRAVQGVGAALLVPGSLALLSGYFPEELRGKAIGVWSGSSAMTAAVGPVLGGWLVDSASWRWVFFINIPLAVAIVAIALWRVPESRNEKASKGGVDWAGAFLATIGLAGVTLTLIEGRKSGLLISIAGGVGLLALIVFFVVEVRSKAPMLPLGIFKSWTFTGANLLTLFLYTALNGMLFFFPLNLIQVQRYTATEAGAALLPMILMMFVLSKWSGGLITKYGARLPLTVGPLITGVGFALAAIPAVGGSYWTTFFPAVLVMGLGMAVSVAPLTTAAMSAAPVEQAGVASGVNNAISRLASLLSVAAFGVVLLGAFQHDLGRRLEGLQLPAAERQSVEAQRAQLAAMQTNDPRVKHAVDRAFVFGFRRILWIAVALSIASAASAQLLRGEEVGKGSVGTGGHGAVGI